MTNASFGRWALVSAAAISLATSGLTAARADSPSGAHNHYQSGGHADRSYPGKGGGYSGGHGPYPREAHHRERHHGGEDVEPGYDYAPDYGYPPPIGYGDDPYDDAPVYRHPYGCVPELGYLTGDFCGY